MRNPVRRNGRRPRCRTVFRETERRPDERASEGTEGESDVESPKNSKRTRHSPIRRTQGGPGIGPSGGTEIRTIHTETPL
jgi:hypothetical protein